MGSFRDGASGSGQQPRHPIDRTFGGIDPVGLRAADEKAHAHGAHATILHLLGYDHKRLTFRHNGRNERLTDNGGEVVEKTSG